MLSILATMALLQPEAPTGDKEILMPESEGGRAFFEQYGFAEAVRVGNHLYLSGVVAGEAEGITLEESLDGTMRYAGSILERAGYDWDDVVDITTYHVDLPASIETVAEVKKRFIPGATHAWTAIDIDRLYPDNGLVEIKITAVKSGD